MKFSQCPQGWDTAPKEETQAQMQTLLGGFTALAHEEQRSPCSVMWVDLADNLPSREPGKTVPEELCPRRHSYHQTT